MHFRYQAEKFCAARRMLMLPHLEGEAHSIALAVHECSLGLLDTKTENLDENVRTLLGKLMDLMDTSGISETLARGTWSVTDEPFTDAEKFELKQTIDELASWFERKVWSSH